MVLRTFSAVAIGQGLQLLSESLSPHPDKSGVHDMDTTNTLRNIGLWGNADYQKSMDQSRQRLHAILLRKERNKNGLCPECGLKQYAPECPHWDYESASY